MKTILSFALSQDFHSVILYPVSLDYSDTSNFGACYFSTQTAVSGKVVQKKRKAYATIPKGSMGRSEESAHVLRIHTIKINE